MPHLQTIHQAVWQSQNLQLTYRLPYHGIELQHLVEPYGLVAKASTWYLVYYRDGFRVQRVAGLLNAAPTGEPFERQADFDLAAFWQDWCSRQEASRSLYPVTVRVAPHFTAHLPHYFGNQIIDQLKPLPEDEWRIVTLHFESLPAARARLLGFGSAIEVVEPRALRASIQDYARQIAAMYDK